MQVEGFDHLVWNVADAEAAAGWYAERLGCAVERLAEYRSGEALFLSVRIDDTTIIDLLSSERSGQNADHICVVVDPATDLQAVADSEEFDVVMGPMRVWGAQGYGESVYVRDLDRNVVELRTYPT
ncbi:MAG: VOC family virulence protein [Acidimicrobiia bacterium]|nr:VOC family virulence protein [Acidimicrobiia bacterium]